MREGPESCLLCTPEMDSGVAAQCLALLGEEGGAQEPTVQTAAAKALGRAHAALTGDNCPALLRPRPQGLLPWMGMNKLPYVPWRGVVVPGPQTPSWGQDD